MTRARLHTIASFIVTMGCAALPFIIIARLY